MDDEVRTLLRDAAPAPTSSLDFDRLWLAGRHRRRLGHVGRVTVLVMSVGAAAVVAIAAPLGGTQPGGLEVADRPVSHCPATDVAAAGFTPPEPYPAYPDITGGVWYGSDELWTVVVPDGRSPARSLWWSTDYQGGAAEPGPEIEVVYERLDQGGTEILVLDESTHSLGVDETDFMIAGMGPSQPGCWQVTATYREAVLQFVLDIPE